MGMTSPRFEFPIRLYFADTDLMGIVYHANYFDYFERARTEWFRAAGILPMDLARESHTGFVLRHATTDWLMPLTIDHEAVATVQVRKMGHASVICEQTVESDGKIACSATLTLVCVDTRTNKPKGIPDALRTLFGSVYVPESGVGGAV